MIRPAQLGLVKSSVKCLLKSAEERLGLLGFWSHVVAFRQSSKGCEEQPEETGLAVGSPREEKTWTGWRTPRERL